MAETDTNSKKVFEVEGVVKECLPETKFLVQIMVKGSPFEVIGYLSGKMRVHYIRILPGDKVRLEISPYDIKRGRIVYRYK